MEKNTNTEQYQINTDLDNEHIEREFDGSDIERSKSEISSCVDKIRALEGQIKENDGLKFTKVSDQDHHQEIRQAIDDRFWDLKDQIKVLADRIEEIKNSGILSSDEVDSIINGR